MDTYDFIKALVSHLQSYERQGGALNTAAFARWLLATSGTAHEPRLHGAHREAGPAQGLSALFYTWSRLVKSRTRKALKESGLSSIEDHGYLMVLLAEGDMKKSELISRHQMEIPSGIEVIRRLLKMGLIEDYEDAGDRRSRRVRITGKGRRVFQASLPQHSRLIEELYAPLSPEEIGLATSILEKLVEHHDVPAEARKSPIHRRSADAGDAPEQGDLGSSGGNG